MKPVILRRYNQEQLDTAIKELLKRGYEVDTQWKQPKHMVKGFITSYTYCAKMKVKNKNKVIV